MTTTYTAYDDAVAYDAAIRYDGVVVTADTAPVDTGNRHAAVPWRNQRGRSNTFRRKKDLPQLPASAAPVVLAPKPEVTASRTITKIILAPERSQAEAAILQFVADKNLRQEKQPDLGVHTFLPQAPLTAARPLPAETAGEQAAERAHRARAQYERRERDDDEVMTLVSLLEGF